MNYKQIAKEIAESKDPGGELLKLLNEVQQYPTPPILIVQAVPDEGKGNPLVGISLFTSRETDFPLDSDEAYIAWVEEYLEFLFEEEINEAD